MFPFACRRRHTVTPDGCPTESSHIEEAIKEDGTITLQYIGPIKAAGKTAGELQTRYLRRLCSPILYPFTERHRKEHQRTRLLCRGRSRQPGEQLYRGHDHVTRAITAAGDFTDFANHKKVVLTRVTANASRSTVTSSGNAVPDPLVYPGDQIQVARRLF